MSAGTGIDPIALLAQWANETDWGTSWAGAPYNLANIRNGPGGSIISYGSLAEFVQACIATYHNGFYPEVLAATNALDQLAAIVASPWSAGHYGGSLASFYAPLEAYDLTPQESQMLSFLYNDLINGSQDNANGASASLAAIKAAVAKIPTTEPAEPTPVAPQPALTAQEAADIATIANFLRKFGVA